MPGALKCDTLSKQNIEIQKFKFSYKCLNIKQTCIQEYTSKNTNYSYTKIFKRLTLLLCFGNMKIPSDNIAKS